MISKKHADAVDRILSLFAESGYNVSVYKTNACNYGLAQTRERIFYIGIRTDLDISFVFPDGDPEHIVTLKDAIWDLRDNAVPTLARNKRNPAAVNNHEYYLIVILRYLCPETVSAAGMSLVLQCRHPDANVRYIQTHQKCSRYQKIRTVLSRVLKIGIEE